MQALDQSQKYAATITVLTGPNKGKHFKLLQSNNVTVGRSKDASIQILDTGLSRCHAYIFNTMGKIHIEDLNSSNGTFVNKKKISNPVPLKHGDKIFMGSSTLLLFTTRLNSAEKDNGDSNVAERDRQTNLLNKKACLANLKRVYKDATRDASHFCVLIITIDDFTKIEKSSGRELSNKVLIQISKTLKKISRQQDYVSRYGKNEFAIVCPSLSPLQGIKFAEFIRTKIESSTFSHNSAEIAVTVSIGIANYPACETSTEMQLMTNAHEAMKHAVQKGKNCTSMANV